MLISGCNRAFDSGNRNPHAVGVHFSCWFDVYNEHTVDTLVTCLTLSISVLSSYAFQMFAQFDEIG